MVNNSILIFPSAILLVLSKTSQN